MSTLNRENAEAIIAPFCEVGAALHWLHPESKRPIGKDWSTAQVASLDDLIQTYQQGNNVGVRLGMPSRLSDGQFLHVLDVDIRDPELADEAWSKVRELFEGIDMDSFPTVVSGSGGASRHVYFTSSVPFYSRKIAVSEGKHSIYDPAKKRYVWRYDYELEIFGTNKQVAMPPSIHPDTGKPYTWEREFDFDMLSMGVGPHIPAANLERLTTAESETYAFETKPPLTFKPGQLEQELHEIPDERIDDYSDWILLGASLHHQTGGSQAGYKLWVQHSRRSAKFNEREMPAKWRSFGRNRRAPTTMASVRTWILEARHQRIMDQFDDVEGFDDVPAKDDTDPLDDLLGTPAAGPAAPVDDLDRLIDGAVSNQTTELDWKSLLDFNDQGAIRPTLHNVALIVQNDPRIAGVIEYNMFVGETVQRKMPKLKADHRKNPAKPTLQLDGAIWEVKDPINGVLWSDEQDDEIRRIIEAPKGQGGFGLKVSDRDLKAAVDITGKKNAFHPICDYLSAQKWDGKARVETLFIDYLGAEDNPYHRDVARLMLIGAVARAHEPGIKLDSACIFEGGQGIGKSTFVKVLGKFWGGELAGDFGNTQKMIEQLSGKWILELAELSGFYKSALQDLKFFMTSAVDRARPAYGRRVREYPRQSVMLGTTNSSAYLSDPSGGRRWWPVRCSAANIDTATLRKEVDQLWAEAYMLYRRMRDADPYSDDLPLYLTNPESQAIAAQFQESRRVESADDGMRGQVEAWLNKPIEDGGFDDVDDGEPRYRNEFCLVEIWCECLGGDRKLYDQKHAQMLGRVVANIAGWDPPGNGKITERYGQQRVYKRQQPIQPTQMDLVG